MWASQQDSLSILSPPVLPRPPLKSRGPERDGTAVQLDSAPEELKIIGGSVTVSLYMATLSRIAPEIAVSDLKEAIDYYSQKLGFELASELPDGGYAIVERDGVAIHLFEQSGSAYGPASVHVFTGQLEDLHSELRSRGATICQSIMKKPWGNRDFRVKDSAGNILKFTEPFS